MNPKERLEKLAKLKTEFEKAMYFHAESFKEIDEKAKYWLTICLPAFLGLVGYGVQNGAALSIYLIVIFCAVSVCLAASIYFFSETLSSVPVEGGVRLPGKLGNRDFDQINYFLLSESHWQELEEDQAKEMLLAAASNELQNKKKSVNLKRAELLLFRGLPAAASIAACATFGYSSACPRGFSIAVGVAAGIVIGTGLVAALLVFAHLRTHKP
jgi:hypothetical protein